MNATTKEHLNRPHPAILVAAASVSAFALAGVGVLTGAIPSSHGTQAPLVAAADAIANAPAPSLTPPAEPVQRAAEKPAAKAAKPVQREARRSAPAAASAPEAPAVPAPIAAVCRDCGVVESVREVAREGEASGLGAVAGGVLGAVLGNQVGGGRGKDVATVLGGVGGAVAGHQIEKSRNRQVDYEIVVRFDDGTSRVMTQPTQPAWRQGDRVRVVDGVIAAGA